MIEVRKTEVFDEWFNNFRDRQTKFRIQARIDRMESGNLGDIQPVGEGVNEARLHFGAGYRLYFVTRGSELIILLCGGDKSSQQQDIKTAINMVKQL